MIGLNSTVFPFSVAGQRRRRSWSGFGMRFTTGGLWRNTIKIFLTLMQKFSCKRRYQGVGEPERFLCCNEVQGIGIQRLFSCLRMMTCLWVFLGDLTLCGNVRKLYLNVNESSGVHLDLMFCYIHKSLFHLLCAQESSISFPLSQRCE